MAIEFRCSACQQLLRVPDDSAGKNAKCPKCAAVVTVPTGAAGLAAPFPPPPSQPFSQPPPLSPPPGQPPQWQFGDAAAKPAGGNPFAAGGGPAPPNPYAASAPTYQPQMPVPMQSGAILPQRVGVDPIFSFAWQVWQQNIGLLAGVTFVVLLISVPIDLGVNLVQQMMEQEGDPLLAGVVGLFGSILSFVVDTFLGLGQAQIALKLVRGQRAEFGDLFGGGTRFFPVLVGSFLFGIAFTVGLLLCIVPGVILLLMFWPFYYLVVEEKVGVLDSFGVASKVTEGNWGTAFLLILLSIVIFIVGGLALCVGIIFAIPLITLLWATAYLMMTGQLSPHPGYAPAAPQPLPAKW